MGVKKESIVRTIELEGGFTDHPNDRGNYTPSGELKGTKYGISARAYPDLDIKSLTYEEAFKIYERDYWNKVIKIEYPRELKPMLFDMSVNHGINGAIKILQRAANVKPDGIVGPITLNAIKDVKLLDLALERVKRFVIITEKRPKNLVFLRGWINRVSEVVDFTNKL